MTAIRLNLVPQKEITNISCSDRDHILRTWEFELYNEYSRWTIDCDTVSLVCGDVTIPGTVSDNRVTIQATSELTSKPGHYNAKLLFEKGSTKLYSAALNLWVEGL